MHHVYLLHSPAKRIVKVGVAGNLAQRIGQLTREHGELELLHHWDCCSGPEAFKLEKALHYWFRARHVRLEWFHDDIIPEALALDPKVALRQYRESKEVLVRVSRDLLTRLAARGMTLGALIELGASKIDGLIDPIG